MITTPYYLQTPFCMLHQTTQMEHVVRKIHSHKKKKWVDPRERRLSEFKNCIKVFKKKGFTSDFLGQQLSPFFLKQFDFQKNKIRNICK